MKAAILFLLGIVLGAAVGALTALAAHPVLGRGTAQADR